MGKAIQQITVEPSFFGGVASYPGEGGYLYFCPTSGTGLRAYSYGLDSAGMPLFTLAGRGPSGGACNGNPTITSLNGQPGTAVVSPLSNLSTGMLMR